MELKVFGTEQHTQVVALYEEMKWLAYLQDKEQLKRAFDQSLYVLGAFKGERLIGFVRCVGDGEHIVLVQDLLVAVDYQRQGIGTWLFQSVWDKYRQVRAFQVNTDLTDQVANSFYQSFGMVNVMNKDLVTYCR